MALLLRFPVTSHYPLLGIVLFIVGFGTTSTVLGAVVAGTAGVTDDEQGLASALVNGSRQVGSAVGVAALLSIAVAQTTGGSTTAPASGYRMAMGVAAGLALVATVISAIFVHDRTARRHHERLHRHHLDEPWWLPERLASAGARAQSTSSDTRSRDVAEARVPAFSCHASVRQRL